MPFFRNNTASIYYEDTGTGDPVIATHGLIENTTYWSRTGITPALSQHFRMISMDLRAHGKTIENGEPKGYDIDTCMDDIIALADHLGLDRFHLISHSTGGFVCVRLAMKKSPRIASLTLTGSASATTFIKEPAHNKIFHDRFALSFENNAWETILENIKKQPFPFFLGIAGTQNNQAMWDMAYEIIKIGNRKAIAEFIRSFYKDPDPRIEGLQKITCPTLILVGQKDELFLESSQLMTEHIPEARLEILEGAGHMLAIERPEFLSRMITLFIREHKI
ncbi:MAG: alpha/beta hydrolase [Proteobacteria bacterium]|nr:alpha/beta hydrolase [Pseudomonadota bacterium]MBU1389968.1 alpha/beta hydrolase [Pseudomonadota bacterium]MBU1544181.1 alpha/beta hydrolase [Pseudomonadota bacterium]MBU2429577.1 alpha/beta hydrolase [Pseudomonadota bacterium]MBU2481151.1 alpha/beta hydrolase [Pseudomonadota bacterium]